jgi:O-methyltransferase involved in polyketide biosynthesis
MEGLLMYLDSTEVQRVLAEVGSLAHAKGSRVGISLVDTQSVQDAQASTSPLRQTWKWGCDEEKAAEFFAAALSGGGSSNEKEGEGKWKVTHVTRVGESGGYPDGANYGCWKNVGKWKRKGKTLYVLAEKM